MMTNDDDDNDGNGDDNKNNPFRSSNTSIAGQQLVEQVVRIERPGIGESQDDDLSFIIIYHYLS